MIELGGPERAPRASSTMTAATAVGLALATIVGGALVQYAPDPLHLTFWVLLAVIVAVGALALFLPRVRDAAGAWRPSLPRVPAGLRRAFVAGALAVSAAYAVGSVFLALGAQVAADLLRSSNALLNGIVIAISAIAIGAVAVLTRRVPSRLALGIGPAAILFGMGSLVLAGIAHSMPLFVVSSVFTGGGYSLMYAGGLGIITATAEVHHRAAVISAAFTVGYLVQAVVALVLGAIATDTGLLVAIELAAVVVMAFAVAAALVANVRAGRRSPTTPVPVS
jgi:MFS family permease